MDCIFCKIIKGELPCYKIYEDDDFLGFLDIFPRVRGHTLLLPKKHYSWVYDVPNFSQYWQVALKITRGMEKAFNPKFVNYLTMGIEVPHAHVHILPRQENDISIWPEVKKIEKEEMTEIAQKLKSFI